MASSLGELSQAELSNIVGGLTLEADGSEAADPDDILKQLGETAFDNFDTFFTDLTNATASAVQPIEIKVIIINDLHLSSLRYSDIIDKKSFKMNVKYKSCGWCYISFIVIWYSISKL